MTLPTKAWVLIIGCIFLQGTSGSHILFLHTCVSYSHRVSYWPLIEALVARGHQVTFIGPFSAQFPVNNVTDIVPKELNVFINWVINENFDVHHRAYGLTPKFVMVYDYICYEACNILLQSPELQDWLKSSPQVDLVFGDTVPECAHGIATKLNAKYAMTLPITWISKYVDIFGISGETSSIPDWDVSYKPQPHLSFVGRAVGALIPLIWRCSHTVYSYFYASIFQKYLGVETDLSAVQRNTSLILVNGDFIEDYPRAFPPLVVKVPGLHVKSRHQIKHNPLDKEIEDFISAKGQKNDGAIYISFGTVAKAPSLPIEIRTTFFNVIEYFPNIRFIWRWDGPKPDTYPKNLLLMKWLDQEALLAHPKIRGFLTQAGRPSMMEAFYNYVPTITFPILAEQDFNAHRFEYLDISINLDFVGLTEEAVKDAITKFLTDPKYKEQTKALAEFAKDTQFKPLDTAVWYTEYVLRNKPEHLALLRPLSQNLYWFQRRDLDVWIFFAVLSYLLMKLNWRILLWFVRKAFGKTSSPTTPKSKKAKSS